MSKLYYDFEVGGPKETPKEWRYQNLKIRAHSPEAAVLIRLYSLSLMNVKRKWKHNITTDQILYLASMMIRRIHEYELVKTNGKTVFHYKKGCSYEINSRLKVKEII